MGEHQTRQGGPRVLHFTTQFVSTSDHLLASYKGHSECIKLLLDSGDDVNVVNVKGLTPLHVACRGRSKDTVELLLGRGANVTARCSEWGRTPMHFASHSGHCEYINYFLQRDVNIDDVTEYGETPLMCAATEGNITEMKFLVEHGADIKKQDNCVLLTLVFLIVLLYV